LLDLAYWWCYYPLWFFFDLLRFSFLPFTLFNIISISLLNYSSMALLFWSMSCIVLQTLPIYLFESSLRPLIILNSRLLYSVSDISFNFLSLDSVVDLWNFGGELLLWFLYLNSYNVICASVGLSFSITSSHKWRTYCSNKVNNSAIKQIFEWVRNNWNPYIYLPNKVVWNKTPVIRGWAGHLTLFEHFKDWKLSNIEDWHGEEGGVER
jgi:hypothetical protein